MSFTNARSIEEALEAMAYGARPIAGGSDMVVAARHGSRPLADDLVAIDRVPELRMLDVSDAGCTIGAAVTHARLMAHPEIIAGYTALADASALVGSPATRNVGTLGGNVMNASPAMDTGAPLVVLGATVELRSRRGTRNLPIAALWRGPGETSAAADELCTAVRLPPPAALAGSAYVRLEYRRAMEIAVVGVAASVVLTPDDEIACAAVALAAVAPTIVALRDLGVEGRSASDAAVVSAVAASASAQATPISDLRASADYRRHVVGVIAARSFDAAVRRARGEAIGVPVNRAMGIGASA